MKNLKQWFSDFSAAWQTLMVFAAMIGFQADDKLIKNIGFVVLVLLSVGFILRTISQHRNSRNEKKVQQYTQRIANNKSSSIKKLIASLLPSNDELEAAYKLLASRAKDWASDAVIETFKVSLYTHKLGQGSVSFDMWYSSKWKGLSGSSTLGGDDSKEIIDYFHRDYSTEEIEDSDGENEESEKHKEYQLFTKRYPNWKKAVQYAVEAVEDGISDGSLSIVFGDGYNLNRLIFRLEISYEKNGVSEHDTFFYQDGELLDLSLGRSTKSRKID